MKRTDLERTVGQKINNRIKKSGGTSPFSGNTPKTADKREQRKIDQALGLVPFAVKISVDLVQQIQDIANVECKTVSEVAAELLSAALESRSRQ